MAQPPTAPPALNITKPHNINRFFFQLATVLGVELDAIILYEFHGTKNVFVNTTHKIF